MAEELHVSVGTVRNNRLVSIFRKLGSNSRLQTLVLALRQGIIVID